MSKKKDKRPPGVLIYFDLTPTVVLLPDSDAGKLFKAILLYASKGEPPNFVGSALPLVWSYAHEMIDRDCQHYNEKVLKAKFAAYVKATKSRGESPLKYRDWLEQSDLIEEAEE